MIKQIYRPNKKIKQCLMMYHTKKFSRNDLLNLSKFNHNLFREEFVHRIQEKPNEIYVNFYQNQFNFNYNIEPLLKLVADTNFRLCDSSLMHAPKFALDKQALEQVREKGINMLCNSRIDPQKLYSFVFEYVETMFNLLKKYDPTLKETYHTNFTKDFINGLCKTGNNSALFFTFENVDQQYLIDIRPTCLYLVQLIDLPNFSFNKNTVNEIGCQPLISSKYLKKSIEGNLLHFCEVIYHDPGHAYVMNRQDAWLFKTCLKTSPELVTEWIHNKNLYVESYNKLHDSDYPLYKTVKTCLFDLVHDRGYQFYLPILRQQLRAQKNRDNIKTKIIRGDFEDPVDEHTLNNVNRAMDWLLNLTEKFLLDKNLNIISANKNNSFIIKKYLDVVSGNGKPIDIVIYPNGKIQVNFLCDDKMKSVSLYEIELLNASATTYPILTHEKILNINKWISMLNNGKLGSNIRINQYGELVNQITNHDCVDVDTFSDEHHLKSIEIFKLERLFNVIKNESWINFSITHQPDIYETNNIVLDKTKITIDTGVTFELGEIDLEVAKPHSRFSTTKYVNLDSHARFMKWKDIDKSFIISPYATQPSAPPFVQIIHQNQDLIFGCVNTTDNINLATAVSSLLCRSINDAKDSLGGYLPSRIVDRAHLQYGSPYAITHLWGRTGNRFVLLRKMDNEWVELVGTALVSQSRNNLFFFTSKYNNIWYPSIMKNVDFGLTLSDGKNKWFDKFDMPNINEYKPLGYNQLANFAVEKIDCRGMGLGKLMIDTLRNHYAFVNPTLNINHCQPLICGIGLHQIADPSWPPFMENIGFIRRLGAETFFIDQPWSRIEPVIINNQPLDNISFNKKFGLDQLYDNIKKETLNPKIHLVDRIDHVRELSKSPHAKLQYVQLLFNFKSINTIAPSTVQI